jgi:hypothetical protein
MTRNGQRAGKADRDMFNSGSTTVQNRRHAASTGHSSTADGAGASRPERVRRLTSVASDGFSWRSVKL